jgi:F-type H+-transporting ATPase subunit b
MDIVKQVGELLLSSIPTIICLLVVWGSYRFLVHGKMQEILAARHARTEGAIQQAAAAIAEAEGRTAEYEQKLREARARVYATQESYRNRVLEQRAKAIAEARSQSSELVKSARAALVDDVAQAKGGLQKQADMLADQIIASILKPATAAGRR